MVDIDPEAAQAELHRIPLDANLLNALEDPSHPGHKSATARRRDLYAAAFGERKSKEGEAQSSSSPNNDPGRNAANSDDPFFAPPPDPKDYRFDPAPDGAPHDVELERKARGWFHQAGIPQWLARNVVSEWNRAIEKQLDHKQTAGFAASTERSLRRTWGDRYESRVAAAQSLVRSLKSSEVIDLLDRSGMANNEYLIRQLVALTEGRRPGR
jgi:hypothetical protein